jgi:hypothetical protein
LHHLETVHSHRELQRRLPILISTHASVELGWISRHDSTHVIEMSRGNGPEKRRGVVAFFANVDVKAGGEKQIHDCQAAMLRSEMKQRPCIRLDAGSNHVMARLKNCA